MFSDEQLRAMYSGGRADGTARRFARLWAVVFGLGLLPRRWVTLEVVGRRSGRVARFPLGMADRDGQTYLVPMLGEHCNWVKNVRAADGRAVIRRRRAVPCQLVELPVDERPPLIRCFLEQVPGARPHIPVDRRAPVADFAAVAPRYPVFRVVPDLHPAKESGGPGRIVATWLAVGAGLGTTVGIVSGDLVAGISIGAALGVAVGSVRARGARRTSPGPETTAPDPDLGPGSTRPPTSPSNGHRRP